MKLGIVNTAYCASAARPEGYRQMRAHGYSYTDFQGLAPMDSPFYGEGGEALLAREREAAEAAGIRVYQAHGIWPTDDTSPTGLAEKRAFLERGIHLMPHLGCRRLVFHPDMPLGWDADDPDLVYRSNKETILRLLPHAERENVILCIENMPMKRISFSRVEPMLALVEEINHPLLAMCLDTGHAAVFSDDCGDAVRRIGRRLEALHIHDNDGTADQHRLPETGVVNWGGFLTALREIGFQGSFSFEPGMPDGTREENLRALVAFGKKVNENTEIEK